MSLPCQDLFAAYGCCIVNKFYLLFVKCTELEAHMLVTQLCKTPFPLPFLSTAANFFHGFCHSLCPCKKKI